MTLQDYLRLMRRGVWLVVVLVIVGGTAGYGVASFTTPTYFARSTVMISVHGDTTPVGLAQGSSFAVQRAPTYAGMATTSAVLDKAVATLGGATTTQDLAAAVNVTVRTGSALIDIDAEATTAGGASARANAVASALAVEAPLLDAPASPPAVTVATVQVAPRPLVADSPRPKNDTLTGAVVGLALSILALLLWHALDDRIRSVADVPRSRGLRMLSVLPRSGHRGQDEERSEALRQLRAVLAAAPGGASTLALAGVSTSDTSDTREVAVDLARAFTETGASVVVIDLTGPSRPLGAPIETLLSRPGIDFQPSRTEGQHVALADDRHDIPWLVPADVGLSAAQLLGTAGGAEAFEQICRQYSHRLLLCPAALDRSEASLAAAISSTSVMVADAGHTSRSKLERAADALLVAQAPHVGVVLVGARAQALWSS